MLGRWALLDIETSGVDPTQDQVIDIGFVIYEDQNLVSKQSVRLAYDKPLDPIIISLTGLTIPELEKKGISWDKAKEILGQLNNTIIIGHNASFEESFLKVIFIEYDISPIKTDNGDFFHDSLDVLPFMLPYFPRLGLESINQIFKLESKEEHQGLPDAKDLLKALIYSHKISSEQKRTDIANYSSLSAWWKKWLKYNFDYTKFDINQIEVEKYSFQNISQWEQSQLISYSKQFQDTHLEWLSLKCIQMLGRQVSGIISPCHASKNDLLLIINIAKNFAKLFPNKTICLCSSYLSPDESEWFETDSDIISLDLLACEIFKQHAEEYSELLEDESSAWSKSLLKFYAKESPRCGPGARVPDLWCRKEPLVDLFWTSCKEIIREKFKKNSAFTQGKLLVISPTDVGLLAEKEQCIVIFWNARQLEWNNDLFVNKLRFSDIDQINLVCKVLSVVDSENVPTLESCKILLDQFQNSMKMFIQSSTLLDKKRIYWDVDFSDFSKKHLSDWIPMAENFLKRRSNLKKFQKPLVDSFWGLLDNVISELTDAARSNSYGLSWRAQSEKGSWEMWKEIVGLENISGTKVFVDYEFSQTSNLYWEKVLSLSAIEKSKRFEKVQLPSAQNSLAPIDSFSVKIVEDVQVQRLFAQIIETTKEGPVFFYAQDLTLSTNLFSYFKKENIEGIYTWSQFIRNSNSRDVNVVFCWDKELRLMPLCKNINLNFQSIYVDRITDLPWFAWAQNAWKKRASYFNASSFESYWQRRSCMLQEKIFPIARVLQVQEVVIFDSRKNKWKGDSWKILKRYLESL